jgi:hypothetical protein
MEWRAGRGGRRRRAAARQMLLAPAAQPPRDQRMGIFDSRLAHALVMDWGWGHTSASQVQRQAQLAHDDERALLDRLGHSPDHGSRSLKALAGLGNNGSLPGNAHRDLVAYLGEPDVPKPLLAKVHVAVMKPRLGLRRQAELGEVAFLLPHVHFAHLYTNHRAVFDLQMLGGRPEVVKTFWGGVLQRRDPRARLHPMAVRENWDALAVPIALHGDAVPVIAVGKAGTKSLDVFSWQSVLALGTTLQVKNYVYSMFEQNKAKTELHGRDTMAEIGVVVLWSLRALFEGLWPSQNHRGEPWAAGTAEATLAGQPLAGGYFGVTWLVKGDLDYFTKTLHLRSYNANEPCDLCPCDKNKDKTWWPTNFGPASAWKANLLQPAAWRALYPEGLHWLFSLEYLSNLNIEPDELHIIYIGTSQYMLGSVLWMLAYSVLAGTPMDNMALVWERISQLYTTMRISCQYTSLGLSSFHEIDTKYPNRASNKHFPKLKGKGAELKGLAPVLLAVWNEFASVTDENTLVAAVLRHQCDLQGTIDEHSTELFLPVEAAAALQKSVVDLLLTYTQLAHRADDRGLLLWNLAPKFHWLWHFGERAQYLCPRRGACLIDEDYVGKIKVVGQACSSGTALHRIQLKIVDKIRWGKSLMNARVAGIP